MITPMDIHNKTFSKGLRGYVTEEVEAFLAELSADYEKIYRQHREMEEEMDTLKTKLRNYEKMETTMSSTLMMAQETAESVKKNAAKEAELALREAQNEAKKIISDAEESRRKMNADLMKTEGDMNFYIEKLLSNFKSAMNLIESAKNTPAPQPVKGPEGEEENVGFVDTRSADLFEEPQIAEEGDGVVEACADGACEEGLEEKTEA